MAEYYDMQEVMSKLRKSEEDVQGLVKEGRLRQYMDSGKAVFKVEDVDTLAEEVVGLDISAFGQTPPDEGSDLDILLEETAGIELQPEDTAPAPSQSGGDDDFDLDLEPDLAAPKESEGGFGLSQMGDLTSADTNVGTIGINILSGTGDAYKLTEDTGGETQAADIDELGSLDADANMESFGSGSGLLDLSLQADDTSLGAVLDDILPTGAEGAGGADLPVDDGMGLLEEPEDLLGEGGPILQEPEDVTAPLGKAQTAPVMPGAAAQMVAVAPMDPKSGIFGVMMFLPLIGIILAAIVLAAAIQNVTPGIVKTLVETKIADSFSLIWVIVAGLAALLLLVLMFSAVSGGGGGGKKTKAPKAKKAKKPKKEKAPKKKKK